jgi:hypothetical protein
MERCGRRRRVALERTHERFAWRAYQPECVRTDEHTCEQFSDNRRLADTFEQLAGNLCDKKDHEQVQDDR